MGYIPLDAEWFLAELIQEITVDEDPRNLVWRNLTLIQAKSPEEAYEKALRLGREGNTEYENPAGKRVKISFRGISFLDVICDPLEDGAELMFHSLTSQSEEQIAMLLRPKEELSAFRPARILDGPDDGPDVASKEVREEVRRQLNQRK
jgi:hypothetical protein